jgi:hypothetical protein
MIATNAAKAARVMATTMAALSLVVLAAVPASAAPPSNDTIAGARVIAAVPFSETVDTTEATTDAEDAQINANCGAPATNGSIWYTLTPTAATGYLVDVSRSNFTAGVIVATGAPGDLSIVTCGPNAVGFSADAGTTYYLMAFSDNPSVVGGQLSMSVTEATPPPTVSMTINPVGTVDNKTGAATLSGTYTCEGEAEFVIRLGELRQQIGRFTIVGFFDDAGLPCGGTFNWTGQAFPNDGGKFSGGKAASLNLIAGCNALGCNVYVSENAIHLRG